MNYVYDQPLSNNEKTFTRYGAVYRLEKRFRMGSRVFYSFISPGMDKLLVVPVFARQYKELETKAEKFPTGKPYDEYKRLVRFHFNPDVDEEEIPNEESSNGIMKVITFNYKDIRASFLYMNNALKIGPEFEIIDNNLFGNGVVVNMDLDGEGDEL